MAPDLPLGSRRFRRHSQESILAQLSSPAVLIGRTRRGLWVVRDPLGMRGGLFTSRAEAARFATLDHGQPRTAILVPYILELGTVASHG